MKLVPTLPEEAREFYTLDQACKLHKPTADRREALRKKFQALHDDSPADQAFAVDGGTCVVTISERPNERTLIRIRSLARYLGAKFFSLAKLSLKDFDNHVIEPDRSAFISEGKTGSRKVDVIAKPAEEESCQLSALSSQRKAA